MIGVIVTLRAMFRRGGFVGNLLVRTFSLLYNLVRIIYENGGFNCGE